VNADFREISVKATRYERKDDTANLLPANILNSIDRLNKSVAGSRLVYEILCEFLHPNIGDLWGATQKAGTFRDQHGTRHVVRTVGLGAKTITGLPEQQMVYAKTMDICADIVSAMPATLDDIEDASRVATKLTQRFAHKAVKNYRDYFANSDPCPCLSGLSVKECRRSSAR
jgi:hypothetical protein